jgi:hypothetical protein
MSIRSHICLTIFSVVYLTTVILTDYSLSGYWTDVLMTILLLVYSVWLLVHGVKTVRWLKWTLHVTNFCVSLFITWLIWLVVSNPFSIDKLKLRGFYFQAVEGRLFSAYFKPVGSYSGGYGNFWIAEMPRYFPIIERQVYWDRTVHHDFGDDIVDGEKVDNYEVVRSYIREEVIAKPSKTP